MEKIFSGVPFSNDILMFEWGIFGPFSSRVLTSVARKHVIASDILSTPELDSSLNAGQ